MAGERLELRFPENVDKMINDIPENHSFFQTPPDLYFKASSQIEVQEETETISKKGKGLILMTEQNTEPLPDGGPVEPATPLSEVEKEPSPEGSVGDATPLSELKKELLSEGSVEAATPLSEVKKEPFPEGSAPLSVVKKESEKEKSKIQKETERPNLNIGQVAKLKSSETGSGTKGKGLQQMREHNIETATRLSEVKKKPLSDGAAQLSVVKKEPEKKKSMIQKDPYGNKKKETERQNLNIGQVVKNYETGSGTKGKGVQQMREQNIETTTPLSEVKNEYLPEGSLEAATPLSVLKNEPLLEGSASLSVVKKEPYDLEENSGFVSTSHAVHDALLKHKKKTSLIQKEPAINKNMGTGIKERGKQKQFEHLLDGPIEPATLLSEVKKEPYDLPPSYDWVICSLFSNSMYTEVYNLLKEHFSSTDGGKCDYSQKYLTWALHPPGYYRDWHIGVRDKKSKRLVGFISGVPARIRVCDKVVKMAEIKLFCVERSLRKQNFAAVMIKELTRRVQLKDIWQAVYATDIKQPHTPLTSGQYWLFPLNIEKAVAIGAIPAESLSNSSKQLPEATVTLGFRKMEKGDVATVTRLLKTYLNQFKVAPDFDKNDVKHWFLPQEDVVYSYVVESPDSHTVTDFFSFYTNNHTVPNFETVKTACLFYTFTTHTSIQKLMKDALIVSKNQGFDIFTVCDLMKSCFLKDLRFIKGQSSIPYYLHNYRLAELKPSEIGLVLTSFE